ncbi:YSIRK-type signal peptide-containing protein [Limosilactobacillus fermentum]|uniref:YSIRK-type signal peptide-containing protein n=2 Tax=Limosilactobacillus fermentum TaxID=1613 RepID=UPI00019C607E|nr:YSIRK-type signal peptide-containing protein [Limosilactobacillus fermentum]EEI22168.1 Gram-positive signal peptide protein, YSIRK family [Limosilactobacillus fermentum ATCC 14931]MCH5403544.1 YSIRK-type signal peptide-containing protein [Limosilactobacillus fermentum]WLV89018.1 YSIRK-type signal peptide-containing protein [Limosilactobacillus fermentum]
MRALVADRHLKEKITIMVGKNNQNLLEQKMGQRYTRWSIWRLSIGVFSVAVASGVFLFSSVALGPTAHAATNPEEVGALSSSTSATSGEANATIAVASGQSQAAAASSAAATSDSAVASQASATSDAASAASTSSASAMPARRAVRRMLATATSEYENVPSTGETTITKSDPGNMPAGVYKNVPADQYVFEALIVNGGEYEDVGHTITFATDRAGKGILYVYEEDANHHLVNSYTLGKDQSELSQSLYGDLTYYNGDGTMVVDSYMSNSMYARPSMNYLWFFGRPTSSQYLNTSKYYNLTDIVPKLLTQKVYYVDIDTGQQLAAPFETRSLTGQTYKISNTKEFEHFKLVKSPAEINGSVSQFVNDGTTVYPYKGYNWRGISWQYIFEKLTTYLYQDLVNGTGEDPLLKKKVDANELGLKTGRGFFDLEGDAGKQIVADRDKALLELLKKDQEQ